MDFIFPNNLRSGINIISIESVYHNRSITYLKNIETIWTQLKDNKLYQNTKLFFIPYQKPINISESYNSELMEEFSYLLHHYIQIFYQIKSLISNKTSTRQKYYIVSVCCLSSFKEVFAKVIQSNKWISKHNQLTKFCHNLDYVIQYFKPDKYIYDFNTLNDILNIDNSNMISTPYSNIKDTKNILPKYDISCIDNKEELVSILTKLFNYLNEWMDIEKINKDVLCLDGLFFNKNIYQEKYLLAILDFLLDN